MSEETTASAPAEAAPTETASAPVEGGESIETSEAPAEVQTIELGGVAVPVDALAELPDDVLRGLTRTVKVNGEEREVSIADALTAVSKAEGADAKMREAARQRKEAEAALARVLEDPVTALQQIAQMRGQDVDARSMLEQQLLQMYEYETMDPQKRAELDERRELERKAKAFEEYQRQEQKRQAEARHRETVQTLQQQMTSTIEAAGVPAVDAPHVFTRAAAIMQGLVAAKGDIPDGQLAAAMEQAVGLAADEVGKSRATLFEADDDAALLERIPVDVQRRIARAYAAKAKKGASSPQRPADAPPKRRQPERRMSPQEWREYLAEKDAAGW